MAYVTSGLQLYLDAKDYASGSTSTTWTDKTGNTNNATLYSFAMNGTTSGWTGDTLAFDGTDDYGSIADSSLFSVGTGEFSINIALQRTRNGVYEYIFGSASEGAATFTFYIYVNAANTLLAGFHAADSSWNQTSTAFSDTTAMHHIVLQRSANALQLYFDGVLVGSANVTGKAVNDIAYPVVLGRHPSFTNNYGAHKYKSVLFYNRALSGTEITQNYNETMSVGSSGTPGTATATLSTVTAASYDATVVIGNSAIPATVSASLSTATITSLTASANGKGNVTATSSNVTATSYSASVVIGTSNIPATVTASVSTVSITSYDATAGVRCVVSVSSSAITVQSNTASATGKAVVQATVNTITVVSYVARFDDGVFDVGAKVVKATLSMSGDFVTAGAGLIIEVASKIKLVTDAKRLVYNDLDLMTYDQMDTMTYDELERGLKLLIKYKVVI